MKILQINAVLGIRSTGSITTEIAEYLETHGHEAYTAYSEGRSYNKSYKIGNSIDKKVHALFSRIIGKQAYYSITSTNKLIEHIKYIKPDVVHLSNLHANYINLKIILEYLATNDIPTVVVLHDCWFYTGKCTHYTVDNCFKWKKNCGSCPRLKKDNVSWFFDYTPMLIENKKEWFGRIPRLAVVGVSDWITNEARKSLLSSAKIITRIQNWVDFIKFRPVVCENKKRALGIHGKFVVLGVASIWSNSKGLSRFIKLAERIKPDEVIVLVGNISQKVKLPDNIIHINETHQIDELVSIYSMADVFLNLSLEESFGKVAAEALACGTPIITNNSTANPELVGDGCGFIMDEISTDQICATIEKIKGNGKKHYSENCIRFAKANFSKDARIEDYLSLYRNIVDSKENKLCKL